MSGKQETEVKSKVHKSFAFTLAEVLITLGIIGVVAAITIPTLMASYQKNVSIERLKSVYSVLESAEKSSEVDNGTSETWDYTLDVVSFMQTYYKPYLKILKESTSPFDSNLLGTTINYVNINGAAVSYAGFGYRAILTEGTIIRVLKNGQFIIISADINGAQGPNKLGRDVFDFEAMWLGPKKLVVAGANNITQGNRAAMISSCQSTTYSGGAPCYCSGIIQYDNWQISGDYPWN